MKKNSPLLPQVYAYVRLSREDMKGSEATESKLDDRATICRRLAVEHQLYLPEENIIQEVGSGTSLTARAGLKHLLSLARTGEMTHLITPYQDRLTRGKVGTVVDQLGPKYQEWNGYLFILLDDTSRKLAEEILPAELAECVQEGTTGYLTNDPQKLQVIGFVSQNQQQEGVH